MSAAKPLASSALGDVSPPKPFAWLLCEELDEIRELRRKRQWDPVNGDTSRNPDADAAHGEPVADALMAPCAGRDPEHPETYADDVFKKAHRESLVGVAFSGG